MARNRFTKLNLGPMTAERHRSVAGSIIIADYIDPTNSQRTLVLERVATDGKKPAKRKVNAGARVGIAPVTTTATAFPGQDTANG